MGTTPVMSMSLKEAAESTVHTLSELVDEATNRLEDLPVPFPRRQQHSRRRPALIVFVVVAALGGVVWMASRRLPARAARGAEPDRDTANASRGPAGLDIDDAGEDEVRKEKAHKDKVRKSA